MLSSTNKKTYTSSAGVRAYINTTLQSPEVSILVKYKDYYLNKSILDIGCGAGRTSYFLRNFTKKYMGIDYSESMIDYCKAQYPKLNFSHCDARDLSQFNDNSYDFILFSYNGIDYISNEDRERVLSEISRVLKNDGVFVFSTHNRNYNNIILKPVFKLSINPKKIFLNMFSFTQELKNNFLLKKEQVNKDNYAILNDSGNNFSLLTYYISKENQVEQLANQGFKVIDIVGMHGQTINLTDDDSNDCWIYFVTQLV